MDKDEIAKPQNNNEVITWNLNVVKEAVDKNFPKLWNTFEICLSVIATLKLKDLKDPTGLNLIGDPSSEKGTVLSCFYGCDHIYRTDGFTPHSFVSGINLPKQQLEKIDLLPRIENKCMLIPELAPVFGKRKEDLTENLSILTRVFDGQGLTLDFGTVGKRGYERPIVFAWIGATTPLPYHVWYDMIRLGTRMFFLEIPKSNENTEDLIRDVFQTSDYNAKVSAVNEVIKNFLSNLFSFGFKNMEWNKKKDDYESYNLITRMAQLLTLLRAPLETWKAGIDETEYEYKVPMVERPKRVMQILYNIARGHALLYGRNYVIKEDVKILVPIVFSSMPDDRRRMWNLLIDNDDYLDYITVKNSFNVSRQHAYRIMKSLSILGVAELHEGDTEDEYDKTRKHLLLKQGFKDLISVLKKL
jgi:hypothetical protein